MAWVPEEDFDDRDDDGSEPDSFPMAAYRDEEPVLVRCPDCGKMVHEEAPRCHHCGSVFEDGAWYAAAKYGAGAKAKLAVALVVVLGMTWYLLVFLFG